MAAYARQAKDSELIQYATEINVRAERRCGELLATTVQHGGDRKTESRSNAPTLNEMGLSKNESSRYQQLAAMPEVPLNGRGCSATVSRTIQGDIVKAFHIAAVAALFIAAQPALAKGGGHSGGHSGSHSSGASHSSGGSHAVKGHTKKDGTYVAPTRATNPNKSKRDNYSSKGNTNPANGKQGTKDPDK